MGPLGSIDCIRASFHPTQWFLAESFFGTGFGARSREIGGQGVTAGLPLAAAVGGFRETDLCSGARCYVDQEDAVVGMIGVAQYLSPIAVWGNVSSVVF